MARSDRHFALGAVAAAVLLAGCAGKRLPPDNEPTLKTLAARQIELPADAGLKTTPEQAIAAYKRFLDAAPKATQRAEAERRLGDLQMEVAEAQDKPDWKPAIAQYQAYLKAHPKAEGNDRVLYQLSRAQEQDGNLDGALAALDRLVREHPASTHLDEAQFRRGELLFTARKYAEAEAAYAKVVASAEASAFRERALYMHGWSVFKQGRLEEALASFFQVLDAKLAAADAEAGELEAVQSLTRADRELVEDTFRVVSLSLENLQGAKSIPPFITDDVRRGYEFRVYRQLAELYLKQERTKDAADTLGAFTKAHPMHAQAPVLQARVIEIYRDAGFASQSLEAKKDYVARYGAGSDFRRANEAGWERAQPLVKTHLGDLTRHYHASAQKTKSPEDVAEAIRWYREFLRAFPADPESAQRNFLLAELLVDNGRLAAAATEYEKTAYGYPAHAQAADAGYSALLAYAAQEKAAAPEAKPALQRQSIDSSLRFADRFGDDKRVGPVLTRAAEQRFALGDATGASEVAERVLALNPPAEAANRRVAWTVVAHAAFDAKRFDRAEKAYGEVLALMQDRPERDAARVDIGERLAASIYRQGEAARAAGQGAQAVGHFNRVASAAPQSSVRANAQYDAAAELIALKDWDGAARALEDFRGRFPQHPLQAQVPAKLALAYTELGRPGPAAAEFERIAAASGDAEVARSALWQAGDLHAKAGNRAAATKVWEGYLKRYPQPLEPAVEARWKLAQAAHDDGHAAREAAWTQEVYKADLQGGNARTPRTRTLGAQAALALVAPQLEAYRKVALVEPLAKNLKLKKQRMEEVLRGYAQAGDYGIAEVTTAATFHTAALYQDFGKAMMASQRPKGLKKAELEQYNVMLEEQAYPFEEKAIELHEVNTRRAATGVYDRWVQASFEALRTLRPVRYGKAERGAAGRPLAELEQAATAAGEGATPSLLTQLAIAYRQAGRFSEARAAYERALKLDPDHANATLDLGILLDLYLGDAARALPLYERFLALTPGGDAAVGKWVADLKNRKPQAVAAAPLPVATTAASPGAAATTKEKP